MLKHKFQNVKEYIFFDIFSEILGKYRVFVWLKNTTISKCQTLLGFSTKFNLTDLYKNFSITTNFFY